MMLDKKFWLDIGKHVVSRYREFIFDPVGSGAGAKDVFGSPYPQYSQGYGIKKRSGTIKSGGIPQDAKFKNSNAPVLTRSLMNDFKLRNTSADGFTFGTTSWGGKVKNLERLGRVISSDRKALPDKVVDYIVEQAESYGEKWWKRKGGGKNITIEIKV